MYSTSRAAGGSVRDDQRELVNVFVGEVEARSYLGRYMRQYTAEGRAAVTRPTRTQYHFQRCPALYGS